MVKSGFSSRTIKNQFHWIVFALLLGSIVFVTQASFTTSAKPNRMPLQSQDNNVYWDAVLHDSRDGYYRNPGWGTTEGNQKTGAVPVGTDVVLRIRTARNDLTSASIRVWDGVNSREFFVPMEVVESTGEYDYWEGTITSPEEPNDYYYNFALTDGSDTDYYNDDSSQDGGTGVMGDSLNTNSWGIVFYDPSFSTPAWHRQTIGYQIFLDRFFNGDPSNDAVGDGSSGDILWWEWDSDGDGRYTSNDAQRVYAEKKNWGEEPGGGSDYFGGDFAGIMAKLDYLKQLGIGEIWFNPFSESPDNHGYSVDNYRSVDPYYGAIKERVNGTVVNDYNKSLEIFREMVSALGEAGINVFYDAVINHVSAQSIYFQRFESQTMVNPAEGFNVPDPYPNIWGAYERTFATDYYDWFKFYTYNHDYDAWWGFKNIPTLKYEQTPSIAEELITGPNSIFRFWLEQGVKGFRLDVNNDYDDGYGSRLVNQLIRDVVKSTDPDAVIMGEIWGRANTWLTGTMNDGVQNMLFREKTIDWIRNLYEPDEDYENFLLSLQENYPPQAFYSLWNILGNHDTARILTELKENIDFLRIATVLQFTFPGVPMIYYGDEVGMTGGADPQNRGTFPWGEENNDIQAHYYKLIGLRKAYPVLVSGGFELLPNNMDGVLSFAREAPNEESPVALTIVSKRNETLRTTIDVSSLSSIGPGTALVNMLDPKQVFTVSANNTIQLDLPGVSELILMIDQNATITDSQPANGKGGFLALEIHYAPIGFLIIAMLYGRRKKR